MPYPPEHKLKSREKILNSAIKLFAKNGFDNTSIDAIMQDANLTRGAFYTHFSSKSKLYAESIFFSANKSVLLDQKPEGMDNMTWVRKLIADYLSQGYLSSDAEVCPLIFLSKDVANSDDGVRETYTTVFKGMNALLARYIRDQGQCDNDDILAMTVLMIGGVAVSRALNDDFLKQDLINACIKIINRILVSEIKQ